MAENALIRRLKALTGFRAFFVTLLLGSFFLFDIRYFTLPYSNAISYFIVFQYLLTIIYAIFIHRIKNLYLFAYTQLILDVLSEIVLIYLTGGIESWFSFTLILTVLSSSIVLNKNAGYITASLSGILYGTLIDLQFYNLLPIPYEKTVLENEFLYNIFIHILSLYVTAYLGGYISHRLERTVLKLEEKDSHLKDLELFNTEVIESLPSGLFTTDTGGVALIFNRAAEEITGKKKGEVIGYGIETALPFLKFPFKYIRREEVLEFKSEERKIIGITISVLKDTRGQETGFIGVFQDLTQLQKLEAEMKQKEKWAAIGELSANIAHEIRNPLASLRGSIEMLREDRIPASHKSELMDIALKEMERLNGIITDFLTYSSPRSLDLQRIDLHLLLNETLELLGNIEQSKNRISIKKEFNGPLYIDADPQKVTQVFWNLGINAIEAMQGGGELTVSTENSHGSIKIIFSDTGAGISPSDIEKIFYPFFTTKEAGTGLGLAIAFRIIEEHNGRIRVRSDPGIYTAFEIILPSSI
ncbi:MAG: ATP-binding protein [Nitrospirota bacterium]|nr:ATP-binding protein [Nitrospirota bacterium]